MSNGISPRTSTLAALAEESLAIERMLLQAHGELTAEIEYFIQEVQTQLAVKADSYKFTIDRLGATAELLRERAQEFIATARGLENVQERLKQRIKDVMLSTYRSEIVGNMYTFKLAESAPKLVIHEDQLPEEYHVETVIREVNKEAIKKDLKEGKTVAGVEIQPVKALRISVSKGMTPGKEQ